MPKSVLVIDAIATHRIRFAAILETAHYVVTAVADVSEAQADLTAYDLIIFGLPGDQPGNAISGLVAMQGPSRNPILCLDSKRSPLRRVIALKAGAQDVLPSKSPDELLLARVRGLIRQSEAERECQRRRVTAMSFGFSERAVEFGASASLYCAGALGSLPDKLAAVLPHRVVVLSADDLAEAEIAPSVPDAFVLGLSDSTPEIERLLPDLRDRMHLRPAPILAVYPGECPEIGTRALALGASEVMEQSASIEEIELRIKNALARKHIRDALRKSDEQSYRLAATDPLTGLYNRRYAETYLGDLTARLGPDPSEICLVLVDLDHFKAVNDIHGHVAGDQVLCEVAQRLQANIRACDLIARYGGEEFLIVLPETSVEEAKILSERLRHAVAASPVRLNEGKIEVTASIGVATGLVYPGHAEQRTGTFDVPASGGYGALLPMFEAADDALYRAKEAGRNRVEFNVA